MQLRGPASLGFLSRNCTNTNLWDIGVLARYVPTSNTTGPLPIAQLTTSQFVLTTCNSPFYDFNSTTTVSIDLSASTIQFEGNKKHAIRIWFLVSGVPNVTEGWDVVFDALKTEPGFIGPVATSKVSSSSDPALDCSSCPVTIPAMPVPTSSTGEPSTAQDSSKSGVNAALIGGIVGGVVGMTYSCI